MKVALVIFRFLIGIAFLLSAWFKLFPIEVFEIELFQHHLGSDISVLFISRLLIGLELVCGMLLLVPLADPLAVRLTLSLLAVYSVYLILVLIQGGNTTPCGCFGSAIELTPAQSLAKNFVMMLGLIPHWRRRQRWPWKGKNLFLIVVVSISLLLPFVLNKIIFPKKIESSDSASMRLNRDAFLDEQNQFGEDLFHQKQIVAFLLTGCDHCKMAALRLGVLHDRYPQLPITLVIVGENQEQAEFIRHTDSAQLPIIRINNLGNVIRAVGSDFPAILLLRDGNIEATLSYYDIQTNALLQWYQPSSSDSVKASSMDRSNKRYPIFDFTQS